MDGQTDGKDRILSQADALTKHFQMNLEYFINFNQKDTDELIKHKLKPLFPELDNLLWGVFMMTSSVVLEDYLLQFSLSKQHSGEQ